MRRLEFLDRHQLHHIDSQPVEVLHPTGHIQERAAPRRPHIRPRLVHRPPGTDMQLIEDHVAERRRPPIPVTPGIAIRRPRQAIGCRVGRGERQFPRIWITLPPRPRRADNEEQIRRPVARSRQDPAPTPIAERLQHIPGRRPPSHLRDAPGQPDARHHRHTARRRRPGPEPDAPRHQRRAHRIAAPDPPMDDGHINSSRPMGTEPRPARQPSRNSTVKRLSRLRGSVSPSRFYVEPKFTFAVSG